MIDPELGDNIVDLGMVRGATVDTSGRVEVEVALTVASCPLRGQIHDDVSARLGRPPGREGGRGPYGHHERRREGRPDGSGRDSRHRRTGRRSSTSRPTARVIAIASGKGGVGKSSVTVNLAVALARLGFVVGLLDADIAGFSVPRMLGLSGQLRGDESRKMLPMEQSVGEGLLKVVSMGFLADEEKALMWRGLILNRALQQFLGRRSLG